MFFGCLTIAINGFSMVFDFPTIAFNGFRWFWTIGQTMRWFRWIVVVYFVSCQQRRLLVIQRNSTCAKKENISRHKKSTFLSRPGSKDPELTVDFRMISALHRGVPISQQARLLFGICHGSKSTQILAPFYQVGNS